MWETWCCNILLIVKNNETLPDIWLCLSSPHGSTVALRKHHCFISSCTGPTLAHPARSEPAFGQRCSCTPILSLLRDGSDSEQPVGWLWALGPRTVGCHCPEGSLERRPGRGHIEDLHFPAVCCYLYYVGPPKCLFPISIAAISFWFLTVPRIKDRIYSIPGLLL